jgi:beta-glucuronidase
LCASNTTRLIAAVFNDQRFNRENGTYKLTDDFTDKLDVIGVNAYLGCYGAFPVKPEDVRWNVAPTKPLLFSEFSGEAFYGQSGDSVKKYSWGEDFQEQLCLDNITMFRNIPNLSGTCPWVLYDFRSPFRLHPTYQKGWNRKGLVSDRGKKGVVYYAGLL